jgi:hypothetical protein
MTAGKVFTDWNDTHSELWGHQPIRLEHEMHKSAAFSMQAIEKLIDNSPREHCNLVKTGAKGSSRVWREGEIGSLGGRQVIEAISRGGLWLNIYNVGAVDPRFHQLVEQMFDELEANIPGFNRPANHQQGILVSSPDAEVYYHADLPGQALVQIAGRKRVYIYPNTPPFIRPEYLEDIALFNVEVDIPYKEWYDAHATVLDIGPGQMLSWPVNAPHRVEKSRYFQHFDDHLLRGPGHSPRAGHQSRQWHAASPLWLQGKEPQSARPFLPCEKSAAKTAALRQVAEPGTQRTPSDRLPAR